MQTPNVPNDPVSFMQEDLQYILNATGDLVSEVCPDRDGLIATAETGDGVTRNFTSHAFHSTLLPFLNVPASYINVLL